jgi:hypothetical protein
MSEPIRDVSRLVEAALELDARGQVPLERAECLVDAVTHREDVLAVLLTRRDEHRALAVETPNIALLAIAPAHVGHVAQPHDSAVGRADHRGGDLLQRVVAAGGLQVEAPLANVDRAARNVGIVRADRADGGVERHPRVCEPLEIDGDRHLGDRVRPGLRGAHAGHGLEPIT